MPKQYWARKTAYCPLCGEPFEQRPNSPQQQLCHPKCRDRARSRQRPPKFLPMPMIPVPLSPELITFREHVFANQPRGAIGYVLRSELLQATFPLPLKAGRRKTFVGRLTDSPFYVIGGVVQNGIYVPFEAPRIPVNGLYELIYVLSGGKTESLPPALHFTCAQNMISDPRIKQLIASARDRDNAATAEAMPQGGEGPDEG